jgi:para-nitrobenzyl esterase
MRHLLALMAASVVLVQGSIACAQVGQFPFVLTREGQMLGTVEGAVASFRGLAYASPPLGPLRWRPPQPAPESSEMRMAYDYGPACLQPSMPELSSYAMSEDCLTLNVFKPFGIDGPLPVMVFIHGGSFVGGTASDPLLDGVRLAQAGVILVTLNYRLGAFGWLARPALAEGASDSPVANYGMMDQIAALRWVRDNIAAFGGDPNNVTLFGAASGAMSVALLMLCEQSRGLFQKAILESMPGRERLRSLQLAEDAGRQLFGLVGRDGNGFDPRVVNSGLLLTAETMLLAKSRRSFGPAEDGMLVKEDIATGFKAGRQGRIPLIIGSNDDETGFGSEPDVKEELGHAGDPVEKLRRLYPEISDKPAELAVRLYTDRIFTEPARLLARLHAATGAPTFRYRFSYEAQAQRSGGDGGHGRELQFVFGAEGVPGAGVLTHRDREVATTLRTYWTNFARTGDPNGPGLPHWDDSAKSERLLLISNDRISSGDDPWSARLDQIERRSPKE